MAKSKKEADKKPAKKASETFHNIMKASVKDNPKPKPETKPVIEKDARPGATSIRPSKIK